MIIKYCYVCGKEKNKNNMNSRPQSASRVPECGGERRNYYGRRNVLRFRFGINYTQARAYIYINIKVCNTTT